MTISVNCYVPVRELDYRELKERELLSVSSHPVHTDSDGFVLLRLPMTGGERGTITVTVAARELITAAERCIGLR